MMEQQEKTYAERVTVIYEKVKNKLGEDRAKIFNEIVRGASLLDEDKNLLTQIDSIDMGELDIEVGKLEEIVEGMKRQYEAGSIYEAFEKVQKIGRTRLSVWRDGVYEDVLVKKEEENRLPWAGVMRSGGPKQEISGIVAVGKDYDVKLTNGGIVINGYEFNDVVRFVDEIVPEVEDQNWDGRAWKGRWLLARDEEGHPLRGGPKNQMFLRKVS